MGYFRQGALGVSVMTMTMVGAQEREAFAIERLLDGQGGWRSLVREMVALWPEEAPLEIGFALVSAAAAIEANFAPGSPAREAALHGYRLAALLSMDVHAMDLLGMAHARAGDLTHYWEIDPFFARL